MTDSNTKPEIQHTVDKRFGTVEVEFTDHSLKIINQGRLGQAANVLLALDPENYRDMPQKALYEVFELSKHFVIVPRGTKAAELAELNMSGPDGYPALKTEAQEIASRLRIAPDGALEIHGNVRIGGRLNTLEDITWQSAEKMQTKPNF